MFWHDFVYDKNFVIFRHIFNKFLDIFTLFVLFNIKALSQFLQFVSNNVIVTRLLIYFVNFIKQKPTAFENLMLDLCEIVKVFNKIRYCENDVCWLILKLVRFETENEFHVGYYRVNLVTKVTIEQDV